jgi:hypothetical protein
MFPIRCPDNSDMLSGYSRNQCPDVAEIRINYLERANAFKELKERAIEAKNSIPLGDKLKESHEGYLLAVKLTECLAIYINMVETQENINLYLNQKANGENYNWNEYTKSIQFFDLQRNALEGELPKLNSIYSVVLKDNND